MIFSVPSQVPQGEKSPRMPHCLVQLGHVHPAAQGDCGPGRLGELRMQGWSSPGWRFLRVRREEEVVRLEMASQPGTQ